ncbi:hypothetical protein [Nibricoccus sp. IMCC34717]|uniref:hypothetical protein n=1 Tax=Nibricoccus sp. IMCC34717 TaxID=3034021 RepID=UPI00384DBC3B
MKTLTAAVWVCALVPAAFAAADGQTREVVNEFKITVHSEVKELAQGYAQAYGQLSRWVNLTYQRDGQKVVLSGVRSIKAVEGVLVVEVGKGALYLINPKDVVAITDDTTASK